MLDNKRSIIFYKKEHFKMYKNIVIATALLAGYTTPFYGNCAEYQLEDCQDYNACNHDLVISNNFNLSGIMSFSGNGVDFLDINGISQNVAVSATSCICIVRNSGVAATLNLTLPTAGELQDGRVLYISANDANLTLTIIAGSGTSLGDSVTASPSSRGVILTYRQANATWYQLT